jgi:hypothetical protein
MQNSASRWVPEYQDGINTTLSRAGESVPSVLYASRATGNVPPFCNEKLGASNIA